MRFQLFGAALLAGLLSGCATAVAPTPPVLSYDRTDCVSTPDLTRAVPLIPQKKKAIWTVNQPVDGSSPCLAHHNMSGPYVVYALPPAGTTKLIELGSVLDAVSLFAPDVTLLDAAGMVTRSFEPDMYMFRTGLYSVQFTPREDERFALVTSNPALVGRKHDTISAGTTSTFIYTGFGGMNWRSGNEAMLSRGFSYAGTLRANVYRPEED